MPLSGTGPTQCAETCGAYWNAAVYPNCLKPLFDRLVVAQKYVDILRMCTRPDPAASVNSTVSTRSPAASPTVAT